MRNNGRNAEQNASASSQKSVRLPGSSTATDDVRDPLRKARKAETVLRNRTDRIVLILENCHDDLNREHRVTCTVALVLISPRPLN